MKLESSKGIVVWVSLVENGFVNGLFKRKVTSVASSKGVIGLRVSLGGYGIVLIPLSLNKGRDVALSAPV